MPPHDLLTPPPLDLREHGSDATSDTRLYIQFQAYAACDQPNRVVDAVREAVEAEESQIHAVVYEHLSDPRGIAILAAATDPALFATRLAPPLRDLARMWCLEHLPHYAMLGRTYALGYEADLDDTLLHRPLRHVLNPDWPWAIWYPLRRSGAFLQLPEDEQREILREHGKLGMQFGQAGAAHDVRLASHGLDPADNDFTIGLTGPDLTPLSQLVEAMRKTTQTSLYLQRLGPFYVARTLWQSPLP